MLQAGQQVDWASVRFLVAAPRKKPTIDDILTAVSKRYGCTKDELKSPSRKRCFSYPRQLVMYLARLLTDYSYPQIGRIIGDRDHTTPLFAFQKISRLRETNHRLAAVLDELAATVSAMVTAREVTVQ